MRETSGRRHFPRVRGDRHDPESMRADGGLAGERGARGDCPGAGPHGVADSAVAVSWDSRDYLCDFLSGPAAARACPNGRAECACGVAGRPGLRAVEHLWRPDPDADAGPTGVEWAALYALSCIRAVLADARCLADWTQLARRGNG